MRRNPLHDTQAAESLDELFAQFSCEAFQAVVVVAPGGRDDRTVSFCVRRRGSLNRYHAGSHTQSGHPNRQVVKH